MGRVAVLAVLACALPVAAAHAAPAPPSPWDGRNPFDCELQDAGYGTAVPHPDADPYCVEFDKRRQNVTELGVADFVSKEPARVAAASDKCFYFQSDHWRGSVVQDDGATKTYEWDGHYFFNRATGDGGAWVTNFSVNGRTADPTAIPGFPAAYAPDVGPGTGGAISHDDLPVDPGCAAKAAGARSPYAKPAAMARCAQPAGGVGARHLGAVTLGMSEGQVRDALGPPVRVHRGFLRYCLRGGGKELVGLPGDRSGESGPVSDEQVRFLLTTNPALRARGIGRGATARALARAFPRARRLFVQGRTRVLRLRTGLLAGVLAGHVRYLAVYDPSTVRGTAALRDWLRRAQ